jgi:hypothetical protein
MMKKIFLGIVTILFIGCTTTAPQRTQLMKEISPEDVTVFDIRVRLNNYAALLSTSIENSADEISGKTDDPLVKENALLWKMNAIPAGYSAMFSIDPLAAGIDTWAFIVQMSEFFNSGQGKDLFGSYQYLAVNTSITLEEQLKEYLIEFNNDSLELRIKENKIKTFAKNNPIKDISFYRKSVLPHLGNILSKKDLSLAQSLGTIEQSIDDFRTGLTIYSAYLPKQARWQAELLVNQSLADHRIDTVFSDFSSITSAIERLTPVIEKKLFYELNQQRLESFKYLDKQRNWVFLELERERQLVFEDLRRLIREEIHNERVQAFKDLEPLIDRILDQSMEKIESPIDHFFIRLIEYTILIGIAIIVLLLLKPRLFGHNKS